MSSFHVFLTSDYLLASLIPLVLFVLSLLILGNPKDVLEVIFGGSRTRSAVPGHFSLQRAAASYAQYTQLARGELSTMRKSYGGMSWAHRRIGYDLGYTKKLARLEESIQVNGMVASSIARLAKEEFPEEMDGAHSGLLRPPIAGDLGRVRESLKHFVRDWSQEGCGEREKIFGPILAVLREADPVMRARMQVLVPGAGLGRLAWEISELGFRTTANELSFFMNLASRFLLSEKTTQRPNQHVLQPFSSWFSHQRTTDTLFRSVSFPDVVPRLSDHLVLAEKDFLSIRPPEGSDGFDFVVTLFFIDTSLNVIETIEHIHSLLRPGGQWINLGPLLWTGGGQAAVELSLEEVLKLAEMLGFDVSDDHAPQHLRPRTVECEYTADQTAMMKWLYQAEFWVATKRL
ncbi:N2227-domain-containing protein [Lentinus tigrinus ALCF2SS1-6]|uniref:N2227-domain-containing protein n=2 Tax=Lentinus tigrinus TaxID=5365 RepID=A0A5C2S317_9APHY|nr:N2227-domain-containing protein [Lentinus tigrinus ALCF2SS1-6]